MPGLACQVEFAPNAVPELIRTAVEVGHKRVLVLRLAASDELTYSLRFRAAPERSR